MPINVDYLAAMPPECHETVITDRDAMLYALTIGWGRDPLDPVDLRYVYEQDLRVFPTMALVVGTPGSWLTDPRTGIDQNKVVHAAEQFECFAPLAVGMRVRSEERVVGLVDRGSRGAMVIIQRSLWDIEQDRLLTRATSSVACRADGGFGEGFGVAPVYHDTPDGAPDRSIAYDIPANAALFYRLNDDRNPLHADPGFARKAGFDRPILHGLCSFGIAAQIATRHFGGEDASLRSIMARFTSPVFPGESISLDFWQIERNEFAFQARSVERNILVLSNGRIGIAN